MNIATKTEEKTQVLLGKKYYSIKTNKLLKVLSCISSEDIHPKNHKRIIKLMKKLKLIDELFLRGIEKV